VGENLAFLDSIERCQWPGTHWCVGQGLLRHICSLRVLFWHWYVNHLDLVSQGAFGSIRAHTYPGLNLFTIQIQIPECNNGAGV